MSTYDKYGEKLVEKQQNIAKIPIVDTDSVDSGS